jgi:hypothetical protein
MVDDILSLMCSPPPTFGERRMNPMLFEALLIGQRSSTEEGTSTQPPPVPTITLALKKFIFQYCLEEKQNNWLVRS